MFNDFDCNTIDIGVFHLYLSKLTFSNQFPIAVELEWDLKWLNVISSDVISLNLKRERIRIGLSS